MSHFSDYIAQRRLDLQTQSQSLNERKFATEQANFERKLQADFENEQRKNEANIQIAKIQAQSDFELMAVQSLLNGLNETQKFFQSEFSKQTAHQLELQKISHETRATSLLERLKNNAEINKIKLQAKNQIEQMILENHLKKDFLTYEKYCQIFFQLLERELGLNVLEANAQNVEVYVKQAYEQLGLKSGYSPYGE